MQRLKGKWQKSKRERLFDITMPVIYLSEDAADTRKNISNGGGLCYSSSTRRRKKMQNGIFDVTLRQIQYFLTVAEAGSITQAAERLYIAQPLLSKKMIALEEQLGLPLLAREGRSVRLTRAGKHLYEMWKKMLDSYKRDLAEASRLQRFEMSNFSIGCFPVLNTSGFLFPFVEGLARRKPDLDIRVKRENRALLLEDLQKKELDMAFLLETDIPEGQDCFETKKVGTCPLVAVVHEKSPLAKLSAMTYDDLNGQRLIFGQPENSPQKQCGIHRLCVEHQVRPESVRYVNSDVTAVVQVEIGQGITLGPRLFYPEDNRRVRLIPFCEEQSIMAVWNKRDIEEVKKLIREFLNDSAR